MEKYRIFSEDRAKVFCLELAGTGSVRLALMKSDMTRDECNYYRAMQPNFERMYKASRKMGAEAFAERMIEALNELDDCTDPDKVRALSKRIEGLQWLMERLSPEVYGKVERSAVIQTNVSSSPQVRIGAALTGITKTG
jgi:hypothetical protein